MGTQIANAAEEENDSWVVLMLQHRHALIPVASSDQRPAPVRQKLLLVPVSELDEFVAANNQKMAADEQKQTEMEKGKGGYRKAH
jgi:hypothetical protein